VERAENLPALLAAAYRAFEYALQALRGAEDHAGPLLPAFVLAAAAAGRIVAYVTFDALLCA
jgi:hypothetical protein